MDNCYHRHRPRQRGVMSRQRGRSATTSMVCPSTSIIRPQNPKGTFSVQAQILRLAAERAPGARLKRGVAPRVRGLSPAGCGIVVASEGAAANLGNRSWLRPRDLTGDVCTTSWTSSSNSGYKARGEKQILLGARVDRMAGKMTAGNHPHGAVRPSGRKSRGKGADHGRLRCAGGMNTRYAHPRTRWRVGAHWPENCRHNLINRKRQAVSRRFIAWSRPYRGATRGCQLWKSVDRWNFSRPQRFDISHPQRQWTCAPPTARWGAIWCASADTGRWHCPKRWVSSDVFSWPHLLPAACRAAQTASTTERAGASRWADAA